MARSFDRYEMQRPSEGGEEGRCLGHVPRGRRGAPFPCGPEGPYFAVRTPREEEGTNRYSRTLKGGGNVQVFV